MVSIPIHISKPYNRIMNSYRKYILNLAFISESGVLFNLYIKGNCTRSHFSLGEEGICKSTPSPEANILKLGMTGGKQGTKRTRGVLHGHGVSDRWQVPQNWLISRTEFSPPSHPLSFSASFLPPPPTIPTPIPTHLFLRVFRTFLILFNLLFNFFLAPLPLLFLQFSIITSPVVHYLKHLPLTLSCISVTSPLCISLSLSPPRNLRPD